MAGYGDRVSLTVPYTSTSNTKSLLRSVPDPVPSNYVIGDWRASIL